jgi:hypothetical protein
MYTFREFYIPERMMGGLDRYIRHGCPPGDFLTAVICNDLRAACEQADDENILNIPAYVAYLYNEAPAQCWGSRAKMESWVSYWEALREAEEIGVKP